MAADLAAALSASVGEAGAVAGNNIDFVVQDMGVAAGDDCAGRGDGCGMTEGAAPGSVAHMVLVVVPPGSGCATAGVVGFAVEAGEVGRGVVPMAPLAIGYCECGVPAIGSVERYVLLSFAIAVAVNI